MQFASDLDKATADRIASGQRMVEVLKQKNGSPMPVEQQVVDLFAAVNKLFIEVPVAKVKRAESEWLEFLNASRSSVLEEIRQSGAVSDDAKKELTKAMDEFRVAHKELFN